jgi:hypothetical protein
MSGMRTKTKRNDINQMAFDFNPVRPDFIFAAPAPAVEPVEAVAGTNATFEVSPGSFRRVHYLGDTHHGRYCQIQFPGATYSTGQPRIQSVNRAVVTPDPF